MVEKSKKSTLNLQLKSSSKFPPPSSLQTKKSSKKSPNCQGPEKHQPSKDLNLSKSTCINKDSIYIQPQNNLSQQKQESQRSQPKSAYSQSSQKQVSDKQSVIHPLVDEMAPLINEKTEILEQKSQGLQNEDTNRNYKKRYKRKDPSENVATYKLLKSIVIGRTLIRQREALDRLRISDAWSQNSILSTVKLGHLESSSIKVQRVVPEQCLRKSSILTSSSEIFQGQISIEVLSKHRRQKTFHYLSKKSYMVHEEECLGGNLSSFKRKLKDDEIKAISINIDMCQSGNRTCWRKKNYVGSSQGQRCKQIILIIRLAIESGIDFIFIQEAYTSKIRRMIRGLVLQARSQQGHNYYFPQNLMDDEANNRTTLILSKHRVRFGQMNFEIQDYEKQPNQLYYFPLQAYCEFQMTVNNKLQTVCMFNCHWRSNRTTNSQYTPKQMRMMQRDCIDDFRQNQKYSMLLVIGDSNMLSSETLQNDFQFVDTYYQGGSKYRGTYLFVNSKDQIEYQRLDRVLVDKGSEKKVAVKVGTKEFLLQSCKKETRSKKQILIMNMNELNYISVTDHKVLDITIRPEVEHW